MLERMEFVIAVFAFGSLLLLAGIVGGDLTYRGATLPRLGRLPRFTLTAIGSALVIASGLLWLRSFSGPEISATPGPDRPAGGREAAITLTIARELPPFHRSEQLEVFVDQRRVGSVEVDAERPLAMLEVSLQKGGTHQYDARLVARLPGGDPSEFTGSGVLETDTSRRFRVILNRSSATVEIVPE